MAPCRLRLLGGVSLDTGDAPAARPLGRKCSALLVAVSLRGRDGLARTQLVDLLWPDQPEREARTALRQCLHQVRQSLGVGAPALRSAGERLVLDETIGLVDLYSFEALAKRDDPASLLDAARLYRGELAEGLEAGPEFARWLSAERTRVQDLAHRALARLAECARDSQDVDAAVDLAHRLLARDTVHEGSHRALMRVLANSGLRAKAAQAWAACREALQDELGVEPCAHTAALAADLGLSGQSSPEPAGVSAPATKLARAPGAPAQEVVLDLTLRGRRWFNLYTREGIAEARKSFEAAAALAAGSDPMSLAMLGWCHWFESISGWNVDAAAAYAQAEACAVRALAVGPQHPSGHCLQGKLSLWRRRHGDALMSLRRAVALEPRAAFAHFHLGDALAWSGHPDQALTELDTAFALEPDEHGVFLTLRGLASWLRGDLMSARAAFERAILRNPMYAWPHGFLVSVHHEHGSTSAACEAARNALALNHRFSISFARKVLPFREASARARLAQAWQATNFPQHEPLGDPART